MFPDLKTGGLAVAIVLTAWLVIIGAYAIAPPNATAEGGTRTPQDIGPVGVVYGCPLEDSCAIDYRADPLGRGVWVVKGPVRRAHRGPYTFRVKVYGCNAEDDCRIDYRRGVWRIIRVNH